MWLDDTELQTILNISEAIKRLAADTDQWRVSLHVNILKQLMMNKASSTTSK